MARTESEQLVFSVEARIAAMEKQMARAGRTVDTTFTGMERRSKRAAQTMEKEMASGAARVGSVMKNFGKGLFAGIAAGGVAGPVAAFGQVAKSIGEIGDQAKRAGVSTDVFQEWKIVAEQARIPVDALTDGLKELSLRGDEFATTGEGSAADAFARLGYSAEELKTKLKDPSALLLEIIDRLGKFDKAARIRISDELFGGSAGERFVELIDQGADGIRATVREAHALGNVMDKEMIAKAAEVDRQFTIVSQTVGMALKSAIVNAATSLQDFIDRFKGFEAMRGAALDQDLARLGKERLDVERKIFELRSRTNGLAGDGILGTSIGDSGTLGGIADQERRLEAIAAEEQMLLKVLEARRKLAGTGSSGSGDTTWTPPAITPPGSGGSGKRDAAAAATEREAEAVRRLIAELEEELRLVGASSTEKEIASTLRRANVDAASAEGQQIAALVTEIERETEALEKNRQAQEARTQAISNMFDMGGDALMSIVDGSMKAEDAVKKLAVQLALAAAEAALLGSGPLAGVFGGGGCLGGTTTLTNFTGARS